MARYLEKQAVPRFIPAVPAQPGRPYSKTCPPAIPPIGALPSKPPPGSSGGTPPGSQPDPPAPPQQCYVTVLIPETGELWHISVPCGN